MEGSCRRGGPGAFGKGSGIWPLKDRFTSNSRMASVSILIMIAAALFQVADAAQSHPAEQVWPTVSSPATYDQWFFQRPWVAVNPEDPDVFFAFVSGKLLKSVDGGSSWQEIGEGLPVGGLYNWNENFIRDPLSFSPFDPGGNTILLGTDRMSRSGVPYRSEDGGETWHPLSICEHGPGWFNQNFKFPGTSVGYFSNVSEDTLFFPVLSDYVCQDVFVSLDGGESIIPSEDCHYYDKHPTCDPWCVPSGCHDNNIYSDKFISLNPSEDGFFETDMHLSAVNQRARYSVLDQTSGQFCTEDNVYLLYEGDEVHFISPVFFADDGKAYTVCDRIVNGSVPVYIDPVLAECPGYDGVGSKWLFEPLADLPAGDHGPGLKIKKLGTTIFFTVAPAIYPNCIALSLEFLAWDPYNGGTWMNIGDLGAGTFDAVDRGGGLFDIYYIQYSNGETMLRVLHVDTAAHSYSVEAEPVYDFTGLFTGLTGFHAVSRSEVYKFFGRDTHEFDGLDGLPDYASFLGIGLALGDQAELLPWDGWTNWANFEQPFWYKVSPVCTSNFTSLAVKEDGTELWAYLSSDAGIWRNRKFGEEDPDPTITRSLLNAFEQVSGGYGCGACDYQIPADSFGNYCNKVIIDERDSLGNTVYAACRSGLWKGSEQTDNSVRWSKVFDPTAHSESSQEVSLVFSEDCYLFTITTGGIWRTMDDVSWTRIIDSAGHGGLVSAAGHLSAGSVKIACAAGDNFYLSVDDGESWDLLTVLSSGEAPLKKVQYVAGAGVETILFLTNDGLLKKMEAFSPSGVLNNSAGEPVVCEDSGVLVEWTAPADWGDSGTGTRTYDVLRDGIPVASGLSEATLSFTDTSGENGVIYLYQVRMNNGWEVSTTTTGVYSADNGATGPIQFNIGASDMSYCAYSGVLIEWSAPSNWADGGAGTRTYDILRDGVVIAAGLPSWAISWTDTTGSAGTSYSYQVRANNGCGYSTTTAGASAADNSSSDPVLPENTAGDEGCADSGVLVEWDAPAAWGDWGEGTRSFEVLRDSTVIASAISPSTFSYTDNGGENGVSYLYRVRAVNGCGLSAVTDGVSAADIVSEIPEEVDSTGACSWQPVAGAEGYNLYRGVLSGLPNLMNGTDDACLRYSGPSASFDCSGDDPVSEPGKLYWYLVTAYIGTCEGTAGSGTGFARDLSAAGSCP